MKNSCLIALVFASGIAGVASAATMRETCLQYPDKFVWVEATNDCAARHPCADPSQPHYTFYCNTDFKDIQVSSEKDAKELANLYVTKKMGMSGGCAFLDVDKAGIVGQDYIQCKTPNGGYIEFEFDDYSESANNTAEYSYELGKCIAYGGRPDEMYSQDSSVMYAGVVAADNLVAKRQEFSCYNVSESQCSEMYPGHGSYVATEKRCIVRK